MNHLVIGIPTYKRPLMLEKLINSIYKCSIDRKFISTVEILIVDNDRDKTAEEIILQHKSSDSPKFKLHYHNYPIKGLSNVRNEIIKKALLFDPDFVVFIDDDQYVTEHWLNELIYTTVKNKGDMVMGPVVPAFEVKVSKAISKWFFLPQFENNKQLNFIMTGNLIMRVEFLKDNQLQFDKRFNTTGAEDIYFGICVLKKNGTIYYAAKALAYEYISKKRGTLKWILQRKYRGANSFVYILVLEKKIMGILKKLLISFVYFNLGVVCLLLLPFKFKYRYIGLIKIAESLGGFSGLLKIRYNEYSKENR
ncbi:Glycosyl transferase family 2 [Salegentibacter holothuriorum]|uniref:Glycosyl transferase family 2 n=1 Tax=Salegentibacter holothuriorum TaxID=241145 RepID=A0A1T5CS08_9FLAO|nr:glycosyltransferase [Salegentibacter holothuriorum]SKB62101.1 Glycosyl transferase family 2 [Salegentibacter holothuriorum]